MLATLALSLASLGVPGLIPSVDLVQAEADGRVELAELSLPDRAADPHRAVLVVRRGERENGALALTLEPGTQLLADGNSLVVVEPVRIDLGASRPSARVELRAYHLDMTKRPLRLRRKGPHLLREEDLVWRLCQSQRMTDGDDAFRQAAVWLARTCDRHRVAAYVSPAELMTTHFHPGTTSDYRPDPFAIEQATWVDAYRWVLEEQQARDAGEPVGARDRSKARRPERTGARPPEPPRPEPLPDPGYAPEPGTAKSRPSARPSAPRPPVERDLVTAIKKSEIRFVLTYPDQRERPFDAHWELTTAGNLSAPLHITVPKGHAFQWNPVNVVLLEDLVLDVPAGERVQASGDVKLYLRSLPDRGQWDGRWSVLAIHEPEGFVEDLLSVPAFLAAPDRVRQAALWISRTRNGRAAEAMEFRDYDVTFRYPDGREHRPDPFDITRADWKAAERIAAIENEGIRERRAAVAAERAREDEAERREIEERNAEYLRQRAEWQAEREAVARRRERTIDSTLLRALANGKIVMTIESLEVPPAFTRVRLEPTPKLGDGWLDLRISAGTVVRDRDDRSRVAYLPPARALIGNPEPVTIPLAVVLDSLDAAGPGTFEAVAADRWAMGLLQHRITVDMAEMNRHPERLGKRGWDASGVQCQLTHLVRAHPERTRADWASEFERRGLDDLFDAMGTPERLLGMSGGPDDPLESLRRQIAELGERIDGSAGAGGELHTEADLVGTWRVASPSRGLELVLAYPDTERLRRTIPPLADPAKQRQRERDLERGFAEATRYRQGYRHDLELRADGTFEARFDPYLSEENPVARGRWIWDGARLTLTPDGTRFHQARMSGDTSWPALWSNGPMRIFEGCLVATLDTRTERGMPHLYRDLDAIPYFEQMSRFTAVMLEKR